MNNRAQTLPGQVQTAKNRKTLVIILVVVGALAVLLLLFFFGKQFVGKAIAIVTPPSGTFSEGEAGAVKQLTDITTNTFTLEVGANIGTKESVGLELELTLPDGFTVKTVTPRFDWGEAAFQRSATTGNTYKFEYATLDFNSPVTGSFRIADLEIKKDDNSIPTAAELSQIRFTSIKVWDLAAPSTNLISMPKQPVAAIFKVGEAGAAHTLDAGTISGNTFTLLAGANIGLAKSVAYEFALALPPGISVTGVIPKPGWGTGEDVFERKTPGPNTYKYEYATLDFNKAVSGSFSLAEITFQKASEEKLTQAELNQIQFTNIAVWNLADSGQNLITLPYVQPEKAVVVVEGCKASDALCGQFCTVNADNGYCGAFCTANQNIYCSGVTGSDFNADLTLDGRYDGQDAQIIFGTRDARGDLNCGETDQPPCNYDKLYICDGASFRVAGLDIYNSGTDYVHSGQTCPYTMEVG